MNGRGVRNSTCHTRDVRSRGGIIRETAVVLMERRCRCSRLVAGHVHITERIGRHDRGDSIKLNFDWSPNSHLHPITNNQITKRTNDR